MVATDAAGNASEQAVTLSVNNVNEAPVIISGPTFSETQITLTSNDPDGDTISLRSGTTSLVTLSGGSSTSYTLTSGGSVTSGSLNVWDGTASTDTGIILMRGTSGGNTGTSLTATSGSTSQWAIYGFAGNDSIVGSAKDDWLFGGAGNDTINGGSGDDWIEGGLGVDSMTGGAGADIFVFKGTIGGAGSDSFSGSGDSVTDFVIGTDKILVVGSNIGNFSVGSNVTGDTSSPFEYRADLDANGATTDNNDIRFTLNVSITDTQARESTIVWMTGNSSANTITGGINNDTIDGGGGNDVLSGGAGNDSLIGGAGNDTLIGGTGKDVLEGGSGSDVFRFSAGDADVTGSLLSFDVIRDYGSGDSIDYGATAIAAMATGTGGLTINANGLVTAGASTLAEFVGKADDASTAGRAALWSDGTDTYLFISDGTAGLGANDLLIQLVGINASSGFGLSAGGDITTIT